MLNKLKINLRNFIGSNFRITRELLNNQQKEQVAVKRPPHNDTVVHIVCRRKDTDMLKNLVEMGADINSVNVSLKFSILN